MSGSLKRNLRNMIRSHAELVASYRKVAETAREDGDMGLCVAALLLVESLEVYHRRVIAMVERALTTQQESE